jgi:ABC-type phosphate transport system ATPase subunit
MEVETVLDSVVNPHPSDIIIAVMGVTGAGKSTFISLCTDVRVQVGHGLQSRQ